ncbi:uncharacterized protein ISCGN_001995 [Ixodes scapularis]
MAVPGISHGPGDAGEELPAETRQRFTISRIPRNMHPDRNAERRQARAVALARSWDSREGTLYVDGAGPVLGVAAIAVASAQGQIRRVASIRAQTVEQVEEAAIALAVVCNPRATIISDSQRACQNFARGVVSQPALRLLRKTAVEGVHLIWTPGHMGQVGNEAANAAARGALYRESVLPQRDLDSALTYSEALKALRTHRAEYPGPAKGLSKEEEFTWRRLQTETFVTPIQLHLWYPERNLRRVQRVIHGKRPCKALFEEEHDGSTCPVMRIDEEDSSAITLVSEDHFFEVTDIVAGQTGIADNEKAHEAALQELHRHFPSSQPTLTVPPTSPGDDKFLEDKAHM